MSDKKDRKKKKNKNKKNKKTRTSLKSDLTYETLTDLLWVSFGRGCTLPFDPNIIADGTKRFEKTVRKNFDKGDFNDPKVLAAALQCCTDCGTIATVYAQVEGGSEITARNFEDASDYLEKKAAGQGVVCT